MEPGALLDLDIVIRDAWEMTPLPASVCRLAALIDDPTSDLVDIVEVVEFDQALTAKLLRASNSAASASNRKIATVAEAVQRLGGGMVLSFATAHGMREPLRGKLAGYQMDEGALWRHSVASALAAQLSAQTLRTTVPSVTFTVALLHDIGKLLLNRFLDSDARDLLRRACEEGKLHPARAEAEILGITHAELGGMMAEHWQLPGSIVRGIHFHHTPDEFAESVGGKNLEEQKICDLAHLANAVAIRVDRDPDFDCRSEMQAGAWTRLALDEGKVDALAEAVAAQLESVLSRYA